MWQLSCREDMTPQEKEQFWRKIQSTVEKDVVRTDRSHPYFRGEENPNIEVLQWVGQSSLHIIMINPLLSTYYILPNNSKCINSNIEELIFVFQKVEQCLKKIT